MSLIEGFDGEFRSRNSRPAAQSPAPRVHARRPASDILPSVPHEELVRGPSAAADWLKRQGESVDNDVETRLMGKDTTGSKFRGAYEYVTKALASSQKKKKEYEEDIPIIPKAYKVWFYRVACVVLVCYLYSYLFRSYIPAATEMAMACSKKWCDDQDRVFGEAPLPPQGASPAAATTAASSLVSLQETPRATQISVVNASQEAAVLLNHMSEILQARSTEVAQCTVNLKTCMDAKPKQTGTATNQHPLAACRDTTEHYSFTSYGELRTCDSILLWCNKSKERRIDSFYWWVTFGEPVSKFPFSVPSLTEIFGWWHMHATTLSGICGAVVTGLGSLWMMRRKP